MGQYQQWLQYQEIRKHLISQAEALEAELAELQDRLEQLEHHEIASITGNPILHALFAYLPLQSVPYQNNAGYTLQTSNSSEDCSGEPRDTISAALRSWGELPNFELHEIKETSLHDNQPSSFFNHSEIELLPEDMIAFFEEHQQTDPQLELPWWLRKITVSSHDEQAGRPIDHNSIRTNRLVQRWIERWGRRSSTTLESTEKTEEISDE